MRVGKGIVSYFYFYSYSFALSFLLILKSHKHKGARYMCQFVTQLDCIIE